MLDSALPFSHTSLTGDQQMVDILFNDVTYTIDSHPESHQKGDQPTTPIDNQELLSHVSGIIKGGQITAIMGASGAGKTTLLNLLACRLPNPPTSGKITANNHSYDIQMFGGFANYVMQRDVLIQTLTIRETLMFGADLKLKVSFQQKKKLVQKLANLFKLQECLDNLVGGLLLKGISGGEKKRTSIAFEIISDSQVLVLDEPTSGLDSLTAYLVVQYLHQMAHKDRKTIFFTIHQPNSEIFELFDRLILLLDGQFIYQGSAKGATFYFSQSFNLTCPEYYNPGDFLMLIMSSASRKLKQKMIDTYKNMLEPIISQQIKEAEYKSNLTLKAPTQFWLQVKTLIARDFLNFLRNPLMVQLRIVQTLGITLFVGIAYYRFTGEYIEELNWRVITGFFFAMALAVPMTNMAAVSLTFPNDRDVFLKEEGAQLYSTTAYFLSRNVIQIPYAIIFPLFQALMIYWLVNLSSTATQFFTFYLISYLLTLNGESLGLIVGSIAVDSKAVSTITTMLSLPLFLFAGFFKNLDTLPPWIGWIQYITPFKYGFAAYTLNEVAFASESRVGELNFDLSLWGNIGMLATLGLSFRVLSLVFLWALRTKLQ